ncbi:hypothetical protein DRE_05424 [Drechslerella stenobrocha 248]|uniref:Uncharacterized protein n=1 Tax=Drechslerella stenobrocha 248 TaxID=1043628 RepID=W7HNF3_9PEZI|nr:hypothetical protein DRE_05424 [Drechslerella stenobrocha 248]
MVIGTGLFSGRFRPKHLPGMASYSTTMNRSGPVLKYDDQSGNLFTEETFGNPSTAMSFLEHPTPAERITLMARYRRTNPKKQEKTLFNLCRQVVLRHAESLTPDVLAGLPWFYGKIIWEDLVHCTADSFTIFKNFCEEYGREPDFNPGNIELCATPTLMPKLRRLRLSRTLLTPLHVNQLASPSTAWLVTLTMSITFDVWDLVELNNLQNLASLTLHFPRTKSGYKSLGRVFKNWVTNKSNFDNLRVLRLADLRDETSMDNTSILTTLNGLSKLRLIELQTSDFFNPAEYTCMSSRNALARSIGTRIGGDGWHAFCTTMCSACFKNINEDQELYELRQHDQLQHFDARASWPPVNIDKLADWLVQKESLTGDKKKVLVDVTPDSPLQTMHTWIYIYRRALMQPLPKDAADRKMGTKRRLSSTDMGGSPDNQPKRKALKSYKAKANKKQDIASLLASFK